MEHKGVVNQTTSRHNDAHFRKQGILSRGSHSPCHQLHVSKNKFDFHCKPTIAQATPKPNTSLPKSDQCGKCKRSVLEAGHLATVN